MANKKIWAYAKDDSGSFIRDELGRLKLFFIWQALKLKKKDIFEFNKLTFFSTQTDESKRSRITPVVKGFYRYIENSEGAGVSGDGESLSHSIAILVLSEKKTINFELDKKIYAFNFSNIKTEDLKIRFESGRIYFPDLVGFFTDDNPYYKKWGGKVAIEVKVSHGCEPEKVQDFLDHNIPIIEINITDKLRFREELNKRPFDENDLERYYQYLTRIFSNKVYGKVLADPSSDSYNKELIVFEKQENSKLKRLLDNAEKKSSLLEQQLASNNNEFCQYKAIISDRDATIKDYSEKIEAIKNRTFLQKLSALFE